MSEHIPSPLPLGDSKGSETPADIYRQRLADRTAKRDALARQDRSTSTWRLIAFIPVAAAALSIFSIGPFAVIPLAPALAVFTVLVVRHDRIIRNRESAERATGFYAG